ncbi:MAG: DUF2782 domain-containing protein [Lysobacteraceae bacterium]
MRTQLNGLMVAIGIGLLASAPLFAAKSAADNPAPAVALPPPSMDDPGQPPAAAPAVDSNAHRNDAPPPLPPESGSNQHLGSMSDANAPADATDTAKVAYSSTDPTPPKPSLTKSADKSERTLTPAEARLVGERSTVTVHVEDNGDRIEEYRNGGQLTRVKVTTATGASYEILDGNGDGRLDQKDAPGGVQPVGWTLFKWH